MIFRRAMPEDERHVFRLLVELRKSGYLEMGEKVGDIKPHKDSAELFKRILTNENVHIILAEEKGEIAALAVAYEIPKLLDGRNRMLIEEMVVMPEFRGKGIGSKLLEFLEDIVNQKGISHIKVTTGTRLRANNFYKKHGFVHFENAYRKKV